MTVQQYNSPLRLAAMIWTGVVSVYTTVVLPLLVGAVVAGFKIAPAHAGLAASAEMGGIAAGTLLAGFVIARIDRRRLVIASALVVAGANLVSLLPSSFELLLPLRVVSGLGSGGLLAAMAAAVAGTRNPDRNFGIFVAAAFLLSSLSFGILTGIVARTGAGALFGTLTALNLSVLLAAPLFPRSAPEVTADSEPEAVHAIATIPVVAALGGILTFYLGVGSVWPVMGGIGSALGIAPTQIGQTLASASIAALIGAMAAAALAVRLGRTRPLLGGLAIVVASQAWLAVAGTRAFAVAPLLFLLSWNFSVPYMMGMLAALDRSGRAVAFNMTLQYIGFAVGPLLVVAVAAHFSILAVIWLGAAGCLMCLLLFAAAVVLARPSAR